MRHKFRSECPGIPREDRFGRSIGKYREKGFWTILEPDLTVVIQCYATLYLGILRRGAGYSEKELNVFRAHYTKGNWNISSEAHHGDGLLTSYNNRSFLFVIEENSGRKIRLLSWRTLFSKCFPPTTKRYRIMSSCC